MDLRVRSFCTACVLLLLSVNSVLAELASSRDTLRGHHNVFISVTTPETADAIGKLRLVKSSLERYLVDELKKSQIHASVRFTDQTLILEVHIDIHRVTQSNKADVFAFISRFDAIQAVQLVNRQAALATTWRATQFGAVTPDQAGLLRSSVIKNLQQFIGDWEAANSAPNQSP